MNPSPVVQPGLARTYGYPAIFSCRDFTPAGLFNQSAGSALPAAARVRPSLSEASGKDIDGVSCAISSIVAVHTGAQTPWPAPDSGTACTMLQPPASPVRVRHQPAPAHRLTRRGPTAVVLFSAFWAALLAAICFCSGVPAWPPDGPLRSNLHLRPAGCRHEPAEHGARLRLARAAAICVPLNCALRQCNLIAREPPPVLPRQNIAPEAILPKYRHLQRPA